MKVKLKCLALDAAIVLLDIVILSGFMKGGWSFGEILLTIVIAALSFGAHFFGSVFIEVYEEKREEREKQARLDVKSEEFNKLMKQLQDMRRENPEFSDVINEFATQVNDFKDKRKSLIQIVELNNGAAKDFLFAKNEEVQRFLLRNLKRFIKHLIVFDAKTGRNRQLNVEDDPHIQKILKNNTELSDLYDKLLDEVAMMGDEFDVNDPGLQSVIESLQELRVGEDDDESTDGEPTLEL